MEIRAFKISLHKCCRNAWKQCTPGTLNSQEIKSDFNWKILIIFRKFYYPVDSAIHFRTTDPSIAHTPQYHGKVCSTECENAQPLKFGMKTLFEACSLAWQKIYCMSRMFTMLHSYIMWCNQEDVLEEISLYLPADACDNSQGKVWKHKFFVPSISKLADLWTIDWIAISFIFVAWFGKLKSVQYWHLFRIDPDENYKICMGMNRYIFFTTPIYYSYNSI